MFANSRAGKGANSASSYVALPPSKPTAPQNITAAEYTDCAVIQDGKCANFSMITWDPPMSTGGVGVILSSYRLFLVSAARCSGSLAVFILFVFVCFAQSGTSDVAVLAANVSSLVLRTLTRGATYTYVQRLSVFTAHSYTPACLFCSVKMSSTNSNGESPQSSEVPFTVPAAPPGVVTTLRLQSTATFDSLTVGWDAPAADNGSPVLGYAMQSKLSGSSVVRITAPPRLSRPPAHC